MTLRRLLPAVLLTGGATVLLTAANVVAGTGTQIDKNPTTRLGAELSKDLSDSQKTVSDRARELDMKQRMLEAASSRMQARATTMPPAAQPTTPPPAAQSATPPPATQQQAAEADATAASVQILNLVKVYQSMKPRAAAAVFEQLDLDIQVAVASKMRSQAMGAIMQAMSSEAATRLTTALARPDEIPVLKRKMAAAAAAAAAPPAPLRRPAPAPSGRFPASTPRKIAHRAPMVTRPAAPSVASLSPPAGMPVAAVAASKGAPLASK